MDDSDQAVLAEVSMDGPDTSFKLLQSSGMGSPGSEQADQLTMVEEMVMEMKTGFVTVLDELAKIQFDEKKQKEWLERTIENERKASEQEVKIAQLTQAVESLKDELSSMSEQMKTCLEQKDTLLQELQRNNQLNNHSREGLHLKTEATTPQSDFDSGVNLPQQCGSSAGATTPPGLSPMVKPFMESLPTGNGVKSGEDHYDSDSASITALANRSLQLSENLRAKYQCSSSRESSNDGDDRENSSFEDTLVSANKMNGGQLYSGLTNGNQVHDHAFAEKQRQRLTSQILSSERRYCSTLWTLIDDYITPLRQLKLMRTTDLNSIFPPYLTQMYAQHCSILRKLEDRVLNWRWNGVVGDIFTKLTDTQENDLLSLYREYVSDFPTALNNLNKWKHESKKFNSFLKNHHHGPGSEGTDVTTLILAPVQRLAHYVLLIKDLLQFTDDSHSDRYYLVASLAILRNFLNQLNEEIQHVVQLVEEDTSARQSSRSAASVKSSGSSCEVNHVLSARDSGIHSGEEILKLHHSPPARQSASRHGQKVSHPKYNRSVMDSYNRRLRLANSQPNIHRLTPVGNSQRLESPYSLADVGSMTTRPAVRDRPRRVQGRKTVDSFPMMQSVLPHRAASPSLRHSAVPRLQLDDYFDPVMETESQSYREESVYKRPHSVVGQSCIYEDYEMDRLTQLAQTRPRSATEHALLREEMFHTDAEAQLQRMLDLQENSYPPQPKRNIKSRDRLSLTPDEEHYGMRSGRPLDMRKVSGIDHLLDSGLLMRSQSPPHSSGQGEERYGQDYGIFGDNDDLEELEDDGDYRPTPVSTAPEPPHHRPAPVYTAPEPPHHRPAPVYTAPEPPLHRPAVSKSKSQGNVPAALSNGTECNGQVHQDLSPRGRLPDHALPPDFSSTSDDQLEALVEQNLQQQQHITTKTLLEMTRGGPTTLTPTKSSDAVMESVRNQGQGEELAVTSVPPTPSTLPRPDSRQGKNTLLRLPKKKNIEKAKLGYSATLSRSVDDVSKNKKKNSLRDSLKNIFNKKKGTTPSTAATVDPETPCSSEQAPPGQQPEPVTGPDIPPSPDSAPQSPDWVLQGSSLAQITLTPLPRQKPPRKPPRARRPATLTGTFRDETGEPFSPV